MCHRNSTTPLILHPPAQLGTKDENFSTRRYKQTLQPIDKPIKLKSEENLEVNEAKTEKPILEKKNKIKFKCEQSNGINHKIVKDKSTRRNGERRKN